MSKVKKPKKVIKKRLSTKEQVKKFVDDFYNVYGKMMTKLANE